MMKQLWISVLSLASISLSGLTIGNVQIELPPSKYDWQLLVNEDFFDDVESEADEWEIDLDEEFEDSSDDGRLQVFTHREGDALETLSVIETYSVEATDPFDAFATAQKTLFHDINEAFPQHQFLIRAEKCTEEGGWMEWELNDGVQDLLHGFVRCLLRTDASGLQSFACIAYSTTAPRSEYNRGIWLDALNQAKFAD